MLPSLYYDHQWKEISVDEESKALAHALGLSPALATFLLEQFEEEEDILDFLHPREAHEVIPGTDEVAERIHQAIKKGERILLFGDYDVDGLTSLALMLQFFEENKVHVDSFLPNRYEEGYGITMEAIEKLPEVDLLISFDCGISSVEEVEALKARGIDVLITDHHETGDILPDAPIMNPKLGYSFPYLAGVGVAYKLARYLSKHYDYMLPKEAIVYAMLGTVCDLMPLQKENRWMVQQGLEAYSKTSHPGLRALLEVTGDQQLDATKVGFQLGPMLNAAGRMGDPSIALNLLRGIGDSPKLAEALKENNEARKEEERKTLLEAEEKLDKDSPMIVLQGPWKKGVLGLVASRLSEAYRKPSVLMDESLSGSCRSVGSFSILSALEDSKDYLAHYGGHDKAAGLQVVEGEFENFRNKIHAYTEDNLDFLDTRKTFSYLSLESGDVTLSLLDELNFLAPFGIGNPQPVFKLSNLSFVEERKLGNSGKAFLLLMKDGDRLFEFIHFDPSLSPMDPGSYDVLFTMSESQFRGILSLKLQIRDLRPSEPSLGQSSLFLPFYQGLADSLMDYRGERQEFIYPSFEEGRVFRKGDASFPLHFPHPESFKGETRELLDDLPQREDLVKIYNWLRKQDNQFSWNRANRPLLAMISLKIFEELELLSYTSDKRTCFYQLKNRNEKMNLETSPTYRMIQRVKEDQGGID